MNQQHSGNSTNCTTWIVTKARCEWKHKASPQVKASASQRAPPVSCLSHLPPHSRGAHRTYGGDLRGSPIGLGRNRRQPYYTFLANADPIVTTDDSVNMVTEAKGIGQPVYVQRLKGSSTRLRRFHELMRERGATRRFAGKIESWPYTPPNDTELVASAIRRALGLETVG